MSQPLEIRPAIPGDAAACQRIVAAVFREYGMSLDLAGWDRDLSDPHQAYAPPGAVCFVAGSGDELAGLVAGHLEETHAELHRLYIDPDARGQGIGRRLCLAIEAWAREAGRRQVRLWSDVRFVHAHRLYLQLGYRIVGSRVLDDLDRSVEFGFERELDQEPVSARDPLAASLTGTVRLEPLAAAQAEAGLWHKVTQTAAAILDCRTLASASGTHRLPDPGEVFARPPVLGQVILAAGQTVLGFAARYGDGECELVLHPSCRLPDPLLSQLREALAGSA